MEKLNAKLKMFEMPKFYMENAPNGTAIYL